MTATGAHIDTYMVLNIIPRGCFHMFLNNKGIDKVTHHIVLIHEHLDIYNVTDEYSSQPVRRNPGVTTWTKWPNRKRLSIYEGELQFILFR